MSSDIIRLITNAQIQLPGAVSTALQQELFSIADQFFKGSNVWLEDIDFKVPGNDPAGTVYQIAATGNVLIDKLMYVRDSDGDAPVTAFMSTPGEITLRTQPNSDSVYIATVGLTVSDPVQRDGYVTMPEWVLNKYREVFLDGLVGRMMAHPAKPYSNTQLSVYHLRKFTSGISAARIEAQRNNVFRAQAWRFPVYGRGSQRGR